MVAGSKAFTRRLTKPSFIKIGWIKSVGDFRNLVNVSQFPVLRMCQISRVFEYVLIVWNAEFRSVDKIRLRFEFERETWVLI